MTQDQEKLVVEMYKAGATYREIRESTGVNSNTASSLIRRKYKAISQLRQMRDKEELEKMSRKVAQILGIEQHKAQALYSELKFRFDRKKFNVRASKRTFTAKFYELNWSLTCPILGIPLDYYSEHHWDDAYPTFDRIDSTKDYVPGNVHIVSWRANRLKNNASLAEMQKMGEWAKAQEGP